jgi:hypothetical protein
MQHTVVLPLATVGLLLATQAVGYMQFLYNNLTLCEHQHWRWLTQQETILLSPALLSYVGCC